MAILVTGAAGFIGSHVAQRLLARGETVVGLDNVNDYYDPRIKEARLVKLVAQPNFSFLRMDIADRPAMEAIFAQHRFERVVHLAAQAGVRYSITNPHAYVHSNIVGFQNILEGCRAVECQHLVYASSSSVYGGNAKLPFSVHDNVDHPLSLYAASKKANELFAHAYSNLFALPTTGLRFFTVYGPWGRPDMAPIKFSKAIISGQPIQIYNNGNHSRDFTYIDDIISGITKVLELPPKPDSLYDAHYPNAAISSAPWRVFNIGGENPIALMDFVAKLEIALNRKAKIEFVDLQVGDMEKTSADCSALRNATGWSAKVSIDQGLAVMVKWCQENLDLL